MTEVEPVPPIDAYLARVGQRLAADGFRVTTDAVEPYLLLAEKSKFETTKMGNVDTSVHAGFLPEPTIESLTTFSREAFDAAKAVRRGFRLPAGFFQSMFSLALAVADSVPAELAAFVATHEAPKHFSRFESVALYDLAAVRLHVYTGRPIWGAFYATEIRKRQERLFG
jgi:hypothetical protein